MATENSKKRWLPWIAPTRTGRRNDGAVTSTVRMTAVRLLMERADWMRGEQATRTRVTRPPVTTTAPAKPET